MASISFDNSVPVAIDYKSGGQIHVVTDDCIGIISKDFKEKKSVAYSNSLRKFCFDKKRTYVLTSDINSVSCSVMMTDGKVEKAETLKLDLLDVAHNGKELFVLGKNQIKVQLFWQIK